VDVHLLQPDGLDSYRYTGPLRVFARGHAITDDGPEATQAALTRLIRFQQRPGDLAQVRH
jgi:hypothetical protein